MQKKKSTTKIMAINPGARYLAIAIFDGIKLREWRIKSLQGTNAGNKSAKVTDILARFIERYQPVRLAIKRLHPSRTSASLNLMAADIRDYCQSQGLQVCSYSIGEMENILFRGDRTNKRELAKLLVAIYPELAPELKREESNRNAYFVRLFEAVALGHVCLGEIINRHKK
jgi:hypothetical protein